MNTVQGKASKASLSLLKSWQLKNWSFLTGLPSSGTKPELVDSICLNMEKHHLPKKSALRILSVDMGIRNLAFCVVETSTSNWQTKSNSTKIDVRTWTRRDLLINQSQPEMVSQNVSKANSKDPEPLQLPGRLEARQTSIIEKGIFEPSALSQIAYQLTSGLLKYKPDIILIERQRFRSGGGAAIQEWTIRVNMLESMIWACLATLRGENRHLSDSFPNVIQISPSRVANFWTGEQSILPIQDGVFGSKRRVPEASGGKAAEHLQRGKAEKISTVRSWVAGDTDVTLQFHDDSVQIAEAFRSQRGRPRRDKLDDLADCLLQAVTWVRWQENRRRIEERYNAMNP